MVDFKRGNDDCGGYNHKGSDPPLTIVVVG